MCKNVISGFFMSFFLFRWGNALQRCSPWNAGSVQVCGRKIFEKNLEEQVQEYLVSCLSNNLNKMKVFPILKFTNWINYLRINRPIQMVKNQKSIIGCPKILKDRHILLLTKYVISV